MQKGKAWTMQLLAVACLSLAAKMEETEVPLSLDLQVGGSKYVFEARTIRRMELLLLSTLRWRMQAITPFSFIDYFLYKVNDDQGPERSSILRSIQIISSTVRSGVDFLEYRPSEIAAAVAIFVAGETQTVNTEKATSFVSQHLKKERVVQCIKMIHEAASNGRVCMPQSPIGVWEAACWSEKSDGSCSRASSSRDAPDPKRRKLNNN